jgi:long-chain acyl-CoA synthetase
MTTAEIRTLADMPFHVAGRHPKPTLVGRCTPGGIDVSSSREFFEQIRDFSLGLKRLGVGPGDRVALICETRPEWMVADLGVLTAGGVTVPIYPTLPVERIRYILADSRASTVVVSDEEQAAKVRAIHPRLDALATIVVIDAESCVAEVNSSLIREVSFADVAREGHRRLMQEEGLARQFKEVAAAIAEDQLATIIYTSGTTGDPKGVMLTHGAIVANLVDADKMIALSDADDALSFLPLCHALERQVVYLYLYNGVTVTFAESLETVARDMSRVGPTVMTGVPRVFEKLRVRILDAVSEAPLMRQRLFWWALGVGLQLARAEIEGREPSLATRLQHGLADRLVLSKIRERTGGRLRFVVSGGAPLSIVVSEFLFAVGIPILEGYGLTETAPVLTVNPEGAPRLGTVGKALPRVDLRIADDGEILARGPNLMLGYYEKPEATAEAIRDGWFYTGDLGHLDEDGYLHITGRKKELLVTAGGKNIAPQPIEQRLKQDSLVAEAVLIGDRRPFVSVLIVPELSVAIARLSLPVETDLTVLVVRDDVRALFEVVIEHVNAELPRYEQIKKFALLSTEFSVATGELTPTLKVRRRVVVERCREVIASLYGEVVGCASSGD